VEPTSVTPFSSPAIERALHAVIVAIVRQFGRTGTEAARPSPFPLALGSSLRALVEQTLVERVRRVAPEQESLVCATIRERLNQWAAWNPGEYGLWNIDGDDPPLMYPAGSIPPASWTGRGWPTLSSLRGVDATCEAVVTDYFNQIVPSATGDSAPADGDLP
jgi:hypothetical protein